MLKDQLLSSAERFARSALQAFLDKDFPIFFLHAGTALEHLTKAYLASLNPSLIASDDFDSLLHVSGLGVHARRPPTVLRTISLREALKRAGQLIPAVDNLSKELTVLVDVKNGVAHLARVESAGVETILDPFLRACEELLAALEVPRDEFWKDFGGMVDSRLSESAKAAEIRASDVLAAARVEFEKRYSAMDTPVREAVLKAIEDGYQPEPYDEDLVACPACGRLALASGGYMVSWEADWDRDDFGDPWLVGAYPKVTIVPSRLRCRSCGLHLDGRDELRAAGVPESWEIKNVDPEDFEAEIEEEAKAASGHYDLEE